MTNHEKAIQHILFSMRLRGNQTPFPARLTPSPQLLALVDEATAQSIYQDILARLEKGSPISPS
jgi:hypothetical protein